MGKTMISILYIILLLGVATSGAPAQDCSWCGTSEAPDTLSWATTIASLDEPGERLVVTGTVYQYDGLTTAPDVTIYVYHTNNEGTYPKLGNEKGNGHHHGYLRGWVRTDSGGRYRFDTIRPAPYFSHGGEPAHIHYTIQPPGKEEYWLNAAWFADDSRVTDQLVAGLKRQGGFSNVMAVSCDSLGVWHGRRDIVLEVYE